MSELLVATANAHKVSELAQLLGPTVRVHSTGTSDARIEVEETAGTFEGNALLKALAWAGHLARGGRPGGMDFVLADDSGLEVDALGGEPGVHSARYAALDDGRPGNSPDAQNNAKLLARLAGVPAGRRTARFRCVLALVPVLPVADDDTRSRAARFFEGTCPGRIGFEPVGGHGFGYDPLFLPDGFERTFAELGEAEKNRLSHRAAAARHLRTWLPASSTNPHGGGR